jgi:glycerophosphoryl diester phosphodiesterase
MPVLEGIKRAGSSINWYLQLKTENYYYSKYLHLIIFALIVTDRLLRVKYDNINNNYFQGPDVRVLQNLLNRSPFVTPTLAITMNYDQDTARAVKQFQVGHKLCVLECNLSLTIANTALQTRDQRCVRTAHCRLGAQVSHRRSLQR